MREMNGGEATARPPSVPFREDCWTEDETASLIEAWGDHYLELNRGNLRQKHWEEVADAVNTRHASGRRPRRTDVQCKNRIDTLKKKYKLEKARIASSPSPASKWRFFDRLDALIGPAAAAAASGKKPSPPVAVPLPYRKAAGGAPALPQALVIRQPMETRASALAGDSYYRGKFGSSNVNYVGSPEMDLDSESSRSRSSSESLRREDAVERNEGDGFRQLAKAIVRFAEIYERVEEAKQKQMIELEKQRMEFAKGLEYQRMQLFVDSQVHIEKMKRARRTSGSTGLGGCLPVSLDCQHYSLGNFNEG